MKALRTRLLVGVWVVNTCVFAIAATGVFFSVRSHLEQNLDGALVTLARASAPTFARRFSEPALAFGASREVPGIPSEGLFTIWSETGEELGRSSSLVEESLPRLATEYDVPALASIEVGKRPFRAVGLRYEHSRPAFPFGSPDARPDERGESGPPRRPPEMRSEIDRRNVTIAVPVDDLLRVLSTLRDVLVGSWLFASAIGSILLWIVIRRGLRPLEELREQVARIDEDGHGASLELASVPSELEPVIAQLRLFVRRMQTALEREQSFTAHAAHELRTPIAGLRATLENALAKPEGAGGTNPAEVRATLARCLEITTEIGRLFEILLDLARSTATSTRDQVALMLLAPEIESACLERSAAASARDLRIEPAVAEDLAVECVPALLRRTLENLLDNAVAYADRGSAISARALAVHDEAAIPWIEITIENRASGLSADVAERAFELFWRGDSARANGGSYGVGLPLCRRITRALGGALSAEYRADVFRVRLRLPSRTQRSGPLVDRV